MIHFYKIGQGAFKRSLPLVYREINVMRLHSSIGVVDSDIWNNDGTCAKYPYRQFPLVSLVYPLLSLVIFGYPWLPCGYNIWLRLQKIIGNEGMIIGLQQTKSHIFGVGTRANQG